MDVERLGDDRADGHARIERGVGVLEDDLHVAAAAGASRPCRARRRSSPIEAALARGRLDQPQQQARQGRLAAAGFADDAQRLAGGQRQAHIVDGADRALAVARRRIDPWTGPRASSSVRHGMGIPAARQLAPSAQRTSGGPSARQRSSARGQRPAKLQPAPRSAGRRHEAGNGRQAARRVPGAARRGREQAGGVGMARAGEAPRPPAPPRRCARHT